MTTSGFGLTGGTIADTEDDTIEESVEQASGETVAELEAQADEWAGITGDPDTTLAEYGGLLGYGYATATGNDGEDSDPIFHSSTEQYEDGEGVIDGGLTGDEETNAPGQVGHIVVETAENAAGAAPWWVWAIALLLVLVLLSDYAEIAASAA